MLNRSIINWKLYLTILPLLAIAVSCNKTVDPVIETLAVTEIGSDQATFNGNLVSFDANLVTRFGFCYSTEENPTLSDIEITFGPAPSSGDYSTIIKDFASEIRYYVRAFVISDGDTFYGNQVSFTSGFSTSLSIGDAHLGGEVAYIATPGDLLYVEGEEHGIIVATVDQSTAAEWGCAGTLITDAVGERVGTGKANTEAIMADCGTAGSAAELCSNLTLSGYSDWFLPSLEEIGKIRFKANSIPSINDGHYWSSTQVDGTNAVSLSFSPDQNSENEDKANTRHVRAIRYF